MAVIDDFDDEEDRKRRSAAGVPVFSRDTIASDCWTAIYLAIPAGDPELLKYAMDTAKRCAGAVCGPPNPTHPFAPIELGADKTQAENFAHAVRRIDDLGDRLREAERAELRETVEAQINAAERVVENWSSGDLAGAVNELEETAEAARETLRQKHFEETGSWQVKAEEFSLDDARDESSWAVVDKEIPREADTALLEQARQTVLKHVQTYEDILIDYATAPGFDEQEPYLEQRLEKASDRLGELDTRLAMMRTPTAGQEPMTVEAIERAPWAAVERPIPGDASSELLLRAREAAARCAADIEDYVQAGAFADEAEFDRCMDDIRAAGERVVELHARLLQRELRDIEAGIAHGDQNISPSAEPMTIEAIERDRTNAIRLDIPADADRELLSLVATTARELRHDYIERANQTAPGELADALFEWGELAKGRQKDAETTLLGADEEERMTIEAIKADKWAAVDRPISGDASPSLLDVVSFAAMDCFNERQAPNGVTPEQWEGRRAAAGERVKELGDRFEKLLRTGDSDQWGSLERDDLITGMDYAKLVEAWQAPAFSFDTIAADPYTAVYLPIPENASVELLNHAEGWARDLERYAAGYGALSGPFVVQPPDAPEPEIAARERATELHTRSLQTERQEIDAANRAEQILIDAGDMHSHYDIGEWEGGYAVFRTYEIDDALLPEYGLPSRVQKLGEAATLHELHQAIIDGSALTAYPLWITEEDMSHETNLWSRADLEAVPRIETSEQLAELFGQAIDDGPSLAERVQRIIEHPELEAGVQDERVLEALAERRKELGLAEPVRQQDDEREAAVYSADEPEQTQSSGDHDAAEIDYVFGREEMTEAKSAAYDRWTGQEIGNGSQSAGQVQDPAQSQSQGRSRGR